MYKFTYETVFQTASSSEETKSTKFIFRKGDVQCRVQILISYILKSADVCGLFFFFFFLSSFLYKESIKW